MKVKSVTAIISNSVPCLCEESSQQSFVKLPPLWDINTFIFIGSFPYRLLYYETVCIMVITSSIHQIMHSR